MSLRAFRATARWVPFLCLPGFAACYTYLPAQIGGPAKGVTIRAEVQGHPTFQVGDRIVRDVTRVDGEVIRWEPDTLALSALGVHSFEQGYDGQGYTVRMAVADITSLSIKQFNKRRTLLLALGTAVAAIVTQQALGGGLIGDDIPSNGGAIH